MKNFAENSDIESRSQRQRQNGKVTEVLSLVRFVYKLYCGIRSTVSALFFRFHRSTFRGQVKGGKHFETSQEIKHPYFNERKAQNVDKATNLYHPRQAHLGTVPSSPAFSVGSDQGHDLFKCSGALRKAWNYPVNFRVPPNTSPKLWSSSLHSEAGRKQWNTSPAVVKRTEKQFKLFSEGKANRDLKQPSTLRAKADSAGSASVERETPFLFSVANVDTPAPTLPGREKGKGKVMPSLMLTSRVPVLPRVKPSDEEKVTSVVRSDQAGSANVCADSEPVPTQNHGTSSVEEPRVKQAENKECTKGKPRKNPLSEDAPLPQAKTVRFCTDSKAVANHNNVTSSRDEQANREPKVSRVKRQKMAHGCLKDKSKNNSSLGDLNSSHFSSADVSTDSHDISSHSHVTSSAEERIDVKPEGSRVKRTMNRKESANVCGDSQVSELERIVEEPLVARIKRTRNEEHCKQPGFWDAQTCINSTEDPSNMTLERSARHVKRKAESGSDAISMSQQTEFVSRQIHCADAQKTAEQPEVMKVVDSPPERAITGPPEPMETGAEENAKILLFGEQREAKKPFTSSFMEELESMETDQQESEIFFGEAETEEMETNQASVFDEFSFAWANVMQLLLAQPAEEMMAETDEETVAASTCVGQLEEIMEEMQEPFQMLIPFGLVGDSNLPVAADMIPVQEETMETQKLGDEFKPMETKLAELVDVKRPLASTVGMPKEETMSTNTPATEEPVVQPLKVPVVQTVTEPVMQTVKEPVMQTVKEPVVQTVTEPVMQTVKEPAMPSLKERTIPPPLVKTESLQSTKPSALIYSEHLQRMEEKLNEPGFLTIEQQQLVAVETEETKSMRQLTMEQLQLVPEDPYFPDGLDSDSDSDDSSDDEYELDLARISQFSELHT